METLWFVMVSLMLAVYVALDGFDFGVGIVYPFVARTETERRSALTAIGPLWNGNEVWLIAGGAVLFCAFPKAYAAGFSGFYLALVIVLWLLIVRGLALELRSHVDHPLWKQGWEAAFSVASLLLALVFGAALGNLIRGVPLTREGYFFVPLWTDFLTGREPGILDWFTVLTGVTSAVILAQHGANYLAMKTEGELYRRSAVAAARAGWMSTGCTVLTMIAVPIVQPSLALNFAGHPVEYVLPVTGFLALAGSLSFRRRARDVAAFVSSSVFILAMLGSVAAGMYPYLLPSTTDPAFGLTAFNASTDAYGLTTGLGWFVVGLLLVVAYQLSVHLAFRGKVRLDGH